MNITSIKPDNNTIFQGKCRNLQVKIDKILTQKTKTSEDKLILSKTIKSALKDIITPSKFLEQGTHCSVYQITHKYAARVPNGFDPKQADLSCEVNFGKGVFSALQNYFGEAILNLGNFQVLRSIGHHRTAGVPEHLAQKYNKNQIEKYYLNKYLPCFADISQGGYDGLARDINKLNDIKLGVRKYCVFDYLNPNNIVAKKGRLFLVNEINTLCDYSYSNTTAKLLNIFINRATKDVLAPDAGNKTKLVRKIFKKVVLASSKADLIHANSKEDFNFWQRALKLCHINDDAAKFIGDLEQIEYQFKSTEERKEKIRNYITAVFLSNPLKNHLYV